MKIFVATKPDAADQDDPAAEVTAQVFLIVVLSCFQRGIKRSHLKMFRPPVIDEQRGPTRYGLSGPIVFFCKGIGDGEREARFDLTTVGRSFDFLPAHEIVAV